LRNSPEKQAHFLRDWKKEEKYFAGTRQKRIWKATLALRTT